MISHINTNVWKRKIILRNYKTIIKQLFWYMNKKIKLSLLFYIIIKILYM